MSKENVRYIYLEEGFEIIESKGSEYVYGMHNHTSVFVLGILLSGHLNVEIEGKETVMEAGDVFIIRPYVPHKLLPEGEYTLVSICLHKNKVWDERDATYEQLKQLLMSYDLLTKKQKRRLLRGYRRMAAFPREELHYGKQLQRILEIYPEERVDIEEMAHLSHWSKYHFIRYFKKRVGLTPHQFQIQNRIRKGQRLLRMGYGVAEVATATGFYDQSHFTKHFIKLIGMTPLDYKGRCQSFIEGQE